jgi:hypothetical protein
VLVCVPSGWRAAAALLLNAAASALSTVLLFRSVPASPLPPWQLFAAPLTVYVSSSAASATLQPHRLGEAVTGGAELSALACLFLVFSPAGVFLAAPYTEAPFLAATLGALCCLYVGRSRTGGAALRLLAATALVAVSCALRSNGATHMPSAPPDSSFHCRVGWGIEPAQCNAQKVLLVRTLHRRRRAQRGFHRPCMPVPGRGSAQAEAGAAAGAIARVHSHTLLLLHTSRPPHAQ